MLLQFVKGQMETPANQLKVERVEIAGCRADYARVFGIPAKDPNAEIAPDGDQFFLRFVAGQWQVVERGPGIDCGDANVKPATAAACQALG